jgi:hypothetical protein
MLRVYCGHGVKGRGDAVYAVLLDVKHRLCNGQGVPAQLCGLTSKAALFAQAFQHFSKVGVAADHHQDVKAWHTHKVRVQKVYQKKAGPAYVKGSLGGGEVQPVDLRRLAVKAAHVFNKAAYRFLGPVAEVSQQKTQAPYPQGDKVNVGVHLAGPKRNFIVQRMIYPGHGNTAGQKGGAPLQKEKISKD